MDFYFHYCIPYFSTLKSDHSHVNTQMQKLRNIVRRQRRKRLKSRLVSFLAFCTAPVIKLLIKLRAIQRQAHNSAAECRISIVIHPDSPGESTWAVFRYLDIAVADRATRGHIFGCFGLEGWRTGNYRTVDAITWICSIW